MVNVARAAEDDIDGLVMLFDEIDEFYGDPGEKDRERRSAQIREILFGDPPLAYLLVARDEGRVVALAAYSFLWPAAGTSASLYVKELFVSRTHRRQDIGRLLMRELSTIALARSCSRVEWTTERTNSAAMRFYEELNAPIEPDKVFFRVEGDQLVNSLLNER